MEFSANYAKIFLVHFTICPTENWLWCQTQLIWDKHCKGPFLAPFQWATDLIQEENTVTAGVVLPVVKALKTELVVLSRKFKSPMVAKLKTLVDNRLAQYEVSEHLQIAAALDPRWKLAWCHAKEAAEVKNTIEDTLSVMSTAPTSNAQSNVASRFAIYGDWYWKFLQKFKGSASSGNQGFLKHRCFLVSESAVCVTVSPINWRYLDLFLVVRASFCTFQLLVLQWRVCFP